MNLLTAVKYGCRGFILGIVKGFEWQIERIQEHWWWIFILVLEIITIPLKLVALIPISIVCMYNERVKDWFMEAIVELFD